MSEHQTCIFVAIGSELLSGDVLESNAHWLQNKIANLEIEMTQVIILEDQIDTLTTAIKNLIGKSDYLLISGGLGPTDDDITREAVAKASDVPLWFNPDSWHEIQEIFKRRNKQAGKSNEKQALQPTGSEVIYNPRGTAPGFELTVDKTTIMTFPGVPSEFHKMVESSFISKFKEIDRPVHFKLWGIGESDLTDKIHQQNLIPKDLPWGTIARKEGLSLRFYRDSVKHPDYQKSVTTIRKAFKDYIFTEDLLTPLELLAQKALELNFMIGLAESCTGGLASQLFTNIPGSSSFYQGGLIAYQNEIKHNLLKVSDKILENHGAVSPECVEAMAHGCHKLFNTQMSLAVSGIAGPSGGTEHKPVGTVYIAVYYKDITRSKHLTLHGSREDIRERSTYALCILALDLLKELDG